MFFWCIDCESSDIDNDKMICKKCNSTNVAKVSGNMTIGDILSITKISKDKSFLEAMSNLYDTDIIEYNSKLAQFKSAIEQEKQKSNVPKCPTCGSTKLSKVSTMSKAGSVIMWGLFSQKVKKTWHCDNCKYEF